MNFNATKLKIQRYQAIEAGSKTKQNFMLVVESHERKSHKTTFGVGVGPTRMKSMHIVWEARWERIRIMQPMQLRSSSLIRTKNALNILQGCSSHPAKNK